MSLPITKPTQSSIKSFFQPPKPKYAPPPSAPQPSTSAPPQPTPTPPTTSVTSTAAAAALARLPPQATIRPITEQDILPLRRLNSLLLPIAFPDTFYTTALTSPHSRIITWADNSDSPKVIGAIVCAHEPAIQNLYIRTLCLLSPYRSHGLMSAALDHIAASATDIKTFTAHVWTNNEEGIAWYKSRGFSSSAAIEGYYLKLRPSSAYLVTKNIDATASSTTQHQTARAPPPPSTTAAVLNLPPRGTMTDPSRPLGPQWNDLPEEMAPQMLAPPKRGSESNSNASSRSSSAARKKKDRYPAAAFTNGA